MQPDPALEGLPGRSPKRNRSGSPVISPKSRAAKRMRELKVIGSASGDGRPRRVTSINVYRPPHGASGEMLTSTRSLRGSSALRVPPPSFTRAVRNGLPVVTDSMTKSSSGLETENWPRCGLPYSISPRISILGS